MLLNKKYKCFDPCEQISIWLRLMGFEMPKEYNNIVSSCYYTYKEKFVYLLDIRVIINNDIKMMKFIVQCAQKLNIDIYKYVNLITYSIYKSIEYNKMEMFVFLLEEIGSPNKYKNLFRDLDTGMYTDHDQVIVGFKLHNQNTIEPLISDTSIFKNIMILNKNEEMSLFAAKRLLYLDNIDIWYYFAQIATQNKLVKTVQFIMENKLNFFQISYE